MLCKLMKYNHENQLTCLLETVDRLRTGIQDHHYSIYLLLALSVSFHGSMDNVVG